MAVNRLYLRCKCCGDVMFLGKHYGEGWYYEDYEKNNISLEEALNTLYTNHDKCFYEMYDNPFEIKTENDMTDEEWNMLQEKREQKEK